MLDRVCDEFETAWKRGTRPVLAEYLQQLPDSARAEGLAELLELDIAYRSNCGESPRVSDYTATFSELESVVVQTFDVASLRRASRVSKQNIERGDPTAASENLPLIPGLTVLRRAGSGGMGIVYQAWDDQLKRMVAVKVLRTGVDSSPDSVARLRREAASAARLNHPNIVPIFQIGEHQGLPFLVMPFVDGGTLRDLIGGQPQDVSSSTLVVQCLVQAVSHAHDRGIIHRDLKPANILMETVQDSGMVSDVVRWPDRVLSPTKEPSDTAWKRPRITDFGLARQLDAAECDRTQSGAILGTPNYLSPEQAAGRMSLIDQRTDIYSIGAILYELLTGRPPHSEGSLAETLDSIRTRDPIPLRRIQPDIPRDLETICLRCLAREPDRRYQSAAMLAADLDRFLNHRPIAARRTSWLEKLQRHMRRFPRATTLTLILSTIVVTSLTISAVVWSRHRQSQENYFRSELAAISRELKFLDREEFQFVSMVDPVRRESLGELATRCTLLLNSPHDLAALRRQIGDVQHRLGIASELAGDFADAGRAYRRAMTVLGDQFTDEASRHQAGSVRTSLGIFLQRTGQLQESEALLRQAVELTSGHSAETVLRNVRALQALADHLLLTGHFAEVETVCRIAIDQGEKLTEKDPKSNEARLSLAIARVTLADLQTLFSRNDDALRQANLAVSQLEGLLEEASLPQRQFLLARALATRTSVLDSMGNTTRAQDDLVRRHQLLRKLATEHPNRPDYGVDAAMSLHDAGRLGVTLVEDKDYVPGTADVPLEERLRTALAAQDQFAEQFPELPEIQRRLAMIQNSLATWLTDKADYVSAPELRQTALQESELQHRASERIWSELASKYPAVWQYRFDLAKSHQRMSITLQKQRKYEEAESLLRQSLSMQSAFSVQHPNIARCWFSLTGLQANLGTLADRRSDLEEAERSFREAIRLGHQALKLNPQHPTGRLLLSQVIDNLVNVLMRTDRHLEAAPLIEEVHTFWTPGDWWNYPPLLSRQQALADAILKDEKLSDGERSVALRSVQDRTITWMRALIPRVQHAPPDFPPFLRSHPAFEHAREREEFRGLLEEADRRFGPTPAAP